MLTHKLPKVSADTAKVLEGIYNATEGEQCVDIDRKGYLHFHAERLSKNVLAMCHTYEQNGDLMRDPEIVFWRYQPDEWYPLECTQDPMGGYTECGVLNRASDNVATFNAPAMAAIVELANLWADNLRVQFPEIANMARMTS